MLSIIIPTLDEAATIGKTLSHTQRLQGDYEIIVVDGGSTDPTRKIAEQRGVRIVKSKRGVAKQLEAGIVSAQGDRFLFLHADCLLPPNAIESIQDAQAGGFIHQYDRFHLLSALQAAINNANARLFRRFSGEQAFFVTKDALMSAGAMPDTHLFETEAMCQALRRAGTQIELFSGPAVSSNRRFRQYGLIGFLKLNWAHALHGFGASEWRLKKHFPKVR